MQKLCERLSRELKPYVQITWSSVLANPANEVPVHTVTGELREDGIYFEEKVLFYGTFKKFEHMGRDEKVVVAKAFRKITGGPSLFVETLL